jgi:hypothetical protein
VEDDVTEHLRCQTCGGIYTREMWATVRAIAPRMADDLGPLFDGTLCERCALDADRSAPQFSDRLCGMPGCDGRQDLRWRAHRWFVVRARHPDGRPRLAWQWRPVCLPCSTVADLDPGPEPDHEPSPPSPSGLRYKRDAGPLGAPGTAR